MADEKEVAYYSAKANAWFNTKLEYDKSLLVLSAGAIGLLITLLTAVGVDSVTLLFVFVGSILSFVICLFSLLAIFLRNAKYLENLIAGKKSNDDVLGFLDYISITSFVIGVILAAIIGLSAATTSLMTKEKKMAEEKTPTQGMTSTNESFNGAVNIAPQTDCIKSFNGAQNIAPPQSGSNTSTSSSTQQSSGGSSESKK